ncbi:MAG: DUF551 domain-containing protein [Patescibacteria group bacterium]|nr:DUF551 domain-containing protein [Patescibacteria group bacterium]
MMDEWQPIETAPESGSFLVWAPGKIGGSQYAVCNKRREGLCIIDGHFAWDMPKPTHWRPLPEPPSSGTSEESGDG